MPGFDKRRPFSVDILKRKASVFKFFRFEESSQKLCFRDGLEGTLGLTAAFQISSAFYGKGLKPHFFAAIFDLNANSHFHK